MEDWRTGGLVDLWAAGLQGLEDLLGWAQDLLSIFSILVAYKWAYKSCKWTYKSYEWTYKSCKSYKSLLVNL